MIKVIIFFLKILDFFYQRKLILFLKKNIYFNKIEVLFDVGAHHGETISFFKKNFNFKKIYSFEASPINFNNLKKKNLNNDNIIIENIAFSSKARTMVFKQCKETSSSTFTSINFNSNYYKKKTYFFNKKNFYSNLNIRTNTLFNYLRDYKISKIDILKIDTEGHEFEIILGLKKKISIVKFIIFEHHFDNMLKKKYTFSEIHKYLKKKKFKKIFKIKMPLRKTIEYIYENKSL